MWRMVFTGLMTTPTPASFRTRLILSDAVLPDWATFDHDWRLKFLDWRLATFWATCEQVLAILF